MVDERGADLSFADDIRNKAPLTGASLKAKIGSSNQTINGSAMAVNAVTFSRN
jgi:hypothetical protein